MPKSLNSASIASFTLMPDILHLNDWLHSLFIQIVGFSRTSKVTNQALLQWSTWNSESPGGGSTDDRRRPHQREVVHVASAARRHGHTPVTNICCVLPVWLHSTAGLVKLMFSECTVSGYTDTLVTNICCLLPVWLHFTAGLVKLMFSECTVSDYTESNTIHTITLNLNTVRAWPYSCHKYLLCVTSVIPLFSRSG